MMIKQLNMRNFEGNLLLVGWFIFRWEKHGYFSKWRKRKKAIKLELRRCSSNRVFRDEVLVEVGGVVVEGWAQMGRGALLLPR